MLSCAAFGPFFTFSACSGSHRAKVLSISRQELTVVVSSFCGREKGVASALDLLDAAK